MKQIATIAMAALAIAMSGCEQQPKLPTFKNTGNPLIKDKFTADPAAMVYDGTLYLYVGHDEYYAGQDSASGGKEFNITEWLCYSTKDMQTWTDHGVVFKPTDFAWAGSTGTGDAWASQVVEKDGKFYYYVTAFGKEPYNSRVVGVAVSDRPTGPFTDPIGKPLITDNMTDNGPRGWWNDIDPTALIDDNGQAWLGWGQRPFLARLKPNMIELQDSIITLSQEEAPGYIEGPWLSKRNGMYYLTYASMSRPKPGEERRRFGESISYSTAPAMEGPWTARGELTGPAENSFTIHPAVVEFKGKWYLFYHNATLTLDGHKGAIGRRSVCVDELHFNADGTMQPVEQTKKGVSTAAQ